jgi:hypothetical protein
MSESQGYKLGMKMGLSDKQALFDAIRERGSKREVALLMGRGAANHAFRSGLKSAAFALSKDERRPAARQKTTRKKTTRKRLTTAKRPAARKASRRGASRPRYFSERQVEAWYKKVPKKVGRYEAYDSTTSYTTEEDMTSEERKDVSVWYEIPGVEDSVWILSQEYRDSPFVLSANDGSRQQFSGTLAQMKKKLASISRRKRKNPSADVISYIVRGRPFTSPTAAARKLQDKLRGLSYVDRVDIDEVGDNLYELQLVGPRNFYGADGELVAGFAAEQGEIERLISFHVGPIVT